MAPTVSIELIPCVRVADQRQVKKAPLAFTDRHLNDTEQLSFGEPTHVKQSRRLVTLGCNASGWLRSLRPSDATVLD